MQYKFRNFDSTTDVKNMLRLIRGVGLDKIMRAFDDVHKTGETDEETAGVAVFENFIDVLLEQYDGVKNALDAIIGGVCENASAEEIGALPLDKYIAVLEQVAFETNFRDCFTAAARLYNRFKGKA